MNATRNAPVSSPAPTAAAGGESLRILVVDDDLEIRTLEARILKNAGYHVDTAADGEAAWRAVRGCDYDLLLIDQMMPGITGLALVRQLRVARIALPVIMVSGSLDMLDTAMLIRDPRSRIHAFVRKPFTVHVLLAAVRSCVTPEASDPLRAGDRA